MARLRFSSIAASVAAILTPAGASLMDANCREFGQQWFQLVPNPFRQIFAGWIVEAWNVVQIVVIEALIKRLEDCFYLGKVTYPPGVWIDIASQIDCHPKRMPVQAAALVALWHVWKTMGGLEGKLFKNFHNQSTLKNGDRRSDTCSHEFISNGLTHAFKTASRLLSAIPTNARSASKDVEVCVDGLWPDRFSFN